MNLVRCIPDFPKPGIMFRDITTALKSPVGLRLAVDAMADALEGLDFDLVVGPESRGFIFGTPLAYRLGKGFVPARKAGKLPAAVIGREYDLEYGTAVIEMHEDAIAPGQRVVLVDDLLATGGTAKAVAELVAGMGAEVVGMVFLIELEGLKGRDLLEGYNVQSVLGY